MLDPFSNGQEVATFAGEVARLSGGSLRIRVVDAGTAGLDYEAATIRSMQKGGADLAFAGTRAWDEFGAKRLRALSAPLLVDSYRLQERVLQERPGRSHARRAATARPGRDRHPARPHAAAVRRRAPPGRAERLRGTDDRHPSVARGRRDPAALSARARAACRPRSRASTESTASSTTQAGSTAPAWTSMGRTSRPTSTSGHARSSSSPTASHTVG